jgi:hypothetical protein
LVLAVALFRREHGRGPSWSELQRILGLGSRAEASFLIRSSYEHGVRWRKGIPNSLDVRPGAVRAALDVVRRARS